MKYLFVTWASAICLLFAYASYTGWTVTDSISADHSGHTGPNVHHK